MSTIKEAFKSFGFNIRKFVSNSSEFMKYVSNNEEKQITEVTKALGIAWQPATDEFTFSITLNFETQPKTKRQLFSEIASLYDPMGWKAPVIVKAKILMQEVWALENESKKKYDWDDNLPKNIIDE